MTTGHLSRMWVSTALCGATIGICFAGEAPSAPRNSVRSGPNGGIVIPDIVGGLRKQPAPLVVPDGAGVETSFGTAGGGETLKVTIFRNRSANVPVWFSQAQRAIEINAENAGAELAVPPSAFSPPGLGKDTGLLAVYDLRNGGKRQSIGVALVTVGDSYMLLNASSFRRSASDTSAWMRAALEDIQIRAASPGQPVRPITRCTTPLAAPSGRPANVPPYGLVTLTTTKILPDTRIPASFWCLDSDLGGGNLAYRPTGTHDRYLLATGAKGAALSVRGEAVVGGTPTYYSVVAVRPGQSDVLAMLDRLPAPSYALALAGTGQILRASPDPAAPMEAGLTK